MRITKFGHACVRVEHGGRVVVLDPGGFTEREAVEGADTVLITHEHPDHLDVGHLRATEGPIYTIEAVRAQIADADPEVAERVQVVEPGQRVNVGFPVAVVGEKHAVIHPDLPHFDNSGFLMDLGGTTVFHPGDSFTDPGAPVDLLLLPVHAPWSRISEVVDFGRAVGARTSLAIHDGLLNDSGFAIVDRNLHGLLDTDAHSYERVTPGSDVSV